MYALYPRKKRSDDADVLLSIDLKDNPDLTDENDSAHHISGNLRKPNRNMAKKAKVKYALDYEGV